jgi:hypothetical protein
MPDKRKKAAKSLKRKMTEKEYDAMQELLPFLPQQITFKKQPEKQPKQITAEDMIPPAVVKTGGRVATGPVSFEKLEEQRMKALLGERSADPEKLKEFKEFRRKTAKSPRPKPDYRGEEPVIIGGQEVTSPEGATLFMLGKTDKPMGQRPMPPRRRTPVHVAKTMRDKDYRMGVIGHEFGHIMDLIRKNYAGDPSPKVDPRREVQFIPSDFKTPAGQQEAINLMEGDYINLREERLQYSIVPLKAAVRNLFGSVPTNRKELNELRKTIKKDPTLKEDLTIMAGDFYPPIDPENPQPSDRARRIILERLIKEDIDQFLKGNDQVIIDFLRAAKAETKDDVPSRTA